MYEGRCYVKVIELAVSQGFVIAKVIVKAQEEEMKASHENQARDYKFFTDNFEALRKKYNGKHIVIKDGEVVGVYDSDLDAYLSAKSRFELGTFIIQHVSKHALEPLFFTSNVRLDGDSAFQI